MAKEKVVVVMPAFQSELTLKKTVADIPAGCVDEIILVDDGSRDQTAEIAKLLNLTVFIHKKNLGYGANQKTCYRLALERDAQYIIMLHSDYQYDSRLVPIMVDLLKLGVCDLILGNRVRTRKECLSSGMPLYKYLANRFLTIIANFALGQNLGEFHSGLRGYRRIVLETIPFENNSDDFVFDAQFLVQAVHNGFILGDVPTPVRYFKEASSINFWRGTIYGLQFLAVLGRYHLHRLGLIRSPLFRSRA